MSYQPSVPRSIEDVGNGTNTPLGSSATFTGTWKEVVEYQSISVLVDGTSTGLAAAGILKLQFSQDGVSVSREITISVARVSDVAPRTLGIIAKYFRVEYVNGSIALATLNIQTILHSSQVELVSRLDQSLDGNEDVHNIRAVITGEDPDGEFRNVIVTRSGNFDVTIGDANDSYTSRVSPAQSLKVANQINLVGDAFDSNALNTTQWTTNELNGATLVNNDGEIQLNTNTTANGNVNLTTNDLARFIPANFNTSHHAIQIPDFPRTTPGTGTNARWWGPFVMGGTTPADGIAFRLRDGVWSAMAFKSGVATINVDSTSWNNAEGLSYFNDNVKDSVNTNVYEIEYNAGTISWRVNGRTVHTEASLASPYSDGVHFPASIMNINTGGATTDVEMTSRAAAIYTLGKGESAARPFFVEESGSGNHLIKTGPGKLERVVIARDGGGGSITQIDIYDDTSAVAASRIGAIVTLEDQTQEVEFDANFNKGLFIDISGPGGADNFITVTYD